MGSRGTNGDSKTTQTELKKLFEQQDDVLFSDYAPENALIDFELKLADKFATAKATKENFFENSVGWWDKKSAPPKREPDHISYNRRTGKVSSRYWYTDKGVYRKSNHWGSEVASCSWGIKGRTYRNEGVSVGKTETAFIKWDDLKPKGMITRKRDSNGKEVGYQTSYFEFKK